MKPGIQGSMGAMSVAISGPIGGFRSMKSSFGIVEEWPVACVSNVSVFEIGPLTKRPTACHYYRTHKIDR